MKKFPCRMHRPVDFLIRCSVIVFVSLLLLQLLNLELVHAHSTREKREAPCRASEENGAGFCLDADKLQSQCVGRMAIAQQSRECKADQWCCLRSGRRFHGKVAMNRLLKSTSVDDAPCGHGSNFNRNLFTSGGESNIRRFARIFDGNPVDPGDVCWIAAIFDKGNATLGIPFTYLCAGAVLNSTHVITVAHCVDRLLSDTGQILIQTGITDASPGMRNVNDGCSQNFAVADLIIPDSYDPDTLDKDFAILKVKGKIRSNDCTCRACTLDRTVSSSSMVTCWVAGFGATREGGQGSLQLTKSTIDFVRRDRCEVLLGSQLSGSKRFKLADSSVCAGDIQRGGICTNDGGAPLTCIVDGRHTLVALGSWSTDCSRMPSIFASLMSCPQLLQDPNVPCNLNEAVLTAAVALTDTVMDGSGPKCGIPGTNEVDPFALANQSPDKQAQDALRVKKEAKSLKTKILTTGFPMMSDHTIPEIITDDDEIRSKQGTIMLPGGNLSSISKLFPAETIVGGATVPLNQICWQVLVSTGCGGSIISDQHILTAAHCVTIAGTTKAKDPRSVRVVLGATQSPVQFPLKDCQELRSVRRVIVHPDYFLGNDTSEWVSSDIAILELDRSIDFRNPCVCRICLQNSEPAPGEKCTVSGFGCQVPTKPSSPCQDQKVRDLMKLNVIMPGMTSVRPSSILTSQRKC
ncbi:transmembrane protease serine 9-like [Paramacrobiotus metropolitanus]|uniref:transmembrane protease serine 9-like n=1 Tax=Paramacrobiotus metropolitanus TaxID=2943436 RepID=UPI00244600D4|nr:transmembrane protease serine 9-like [Paramacrobiotus metropolitanus]